MPYFNYHAKIIQKIKTGELTSYYFDSDYSNIGFCLVLCFGNKKYPIRENHFDEYFKLIGTFYQTKKQNNIYVTNFLA